MYRLCALVLALASQALLAQDSSLIRELPPEPESIVRDYPASQSMPPIMRLPDIYIYYTGAREALGMDRAASQISTFSQTDIQQIPVQSTAQLLSYIQGLDLRQRGPGGVQADIGLQGSTFDQVLVLIDGVRISDAQTGHHQLNSLVPLDAIQSIDIIRGAAASRYGMGALGGVINIHTLQIPAPNSEHKAPYTVANVYSGSSFENDTSEGFRYAAKGARLTSMQSIKLGDRGAYAGFLYSGSFDQGNGYRYNTAFNTQRHLAKVTLYHPLMGSWSARQVWVNNQFGANGFYAAPGDKNSEESVNTRWLMIDQTKSWSRRGSWVMDLHSNASLRQNRDHYVYIAANPDLYQNFHWLQSRQFESRLSLQSRKTLFRLGAEYRDDTLASENGKGQPSLGYRSRSMMGTYALASQQLKFTPLDLLIQAGLYGLFDIKNQGWLQNGQSRQWFPGVEIQIRPKIRALQSWNPQINTAYGTGQRLPTFTDLYYVGPSNVANPLLQNEQAGSWQLGLRAARNENIWRADRDNPLLQRTQFSAYYFSRNTSQLIDWVKDSAAGKWNPVNYASQRCQGLDAEWRYQMDRWNLRLGFLAMGMRQTETNPSLISKNALNYLRQQSLVGLSYSLRENWSLQTQLRHWVRMADSETAYTLVDAQVQYHYAWPHPYIDSDRWTATVYLQVQNALNTQYREIASVPMPPRWFNCGLRFTL